MLRVPDLRHTAAVIGISCLRTCTAETAPDCTILINPLSTRSQDNAVRRLEGGCSDYDRAV